MIHPIDNYVGMTKFFLNVTEPCQGRVPRPEGFRVIELSEPLPGPYYLYLLLKEKIDTPHAVSWLKRKFGGKWKWLGLKDSNAVTVQLLSSTSSVGKVKAQLGRGCLRLLPLGLGRLSGRSLKGNLFVIDINFECIPKPLEGTYPVPGYFSYQRFGTARPITHVVGKLILQNKWEEAVRVFLGEPTPWESEKARRIRLKYYEEGPKVYLNAPKFMDLERSLAIRILKGYSAKRALRSLPVFELFLQAYQSYLYNKLLSKSDDPCKGPVRLPGPGAEEYSELLEEEGVSFEDFKRFGLRAAPRKPCHETRVKGFVKDRTLTLVFALPKGYYATSLLREIVKNPFWV